MYLLFSVLRRIRDYDEFDIENEDTWNRSGAIEATSDRMTEAFKIELRVSDICQTFCIYSINLVETLLYT